MTKHTFEEKPNIVSQVRNGTPILRISRERHIREGMILEWFRKYDLDGKRGLLTVPYIKPAPDFKEEVIRLVIEKIIPLTQVVLEYKVSKSALECWVTTYGLRDMQYYIKQRTVDDHLKS